MRAPTSFRLNENDPEEAAALALIEAWQAQGVPLRQIITQAVLALHDKERQTVFIGELADRLNEALDKVNSLAERSQFTLPAPPAQLPDGDSVEVNDALIAAVQRNVKRGRRLE